MPTSPSTVIVQLSVSTRGVTSAVSAGQSSPVSYCPGGSRSARPALAARRFPVNPRVTGMRHILPVAVGVIRTGRPDGQKV
jgi:hypothetical protein